MFWILKHRGYLEVNVATRIVLARFGQLFRRCLNPTKRNANRAQQSSEFVLIYPYQSSPFLRLHKV